MNLKGKKILLTGASTGLGRALATCLVKEGAVVFGISRTGKLLKSLQEELLSPKFIYQRSDLSKSGAWKKIIKSLKVNKFIPDIVIFNAAISTNDMENGINSGINRQTFETNYFSNLEALEVLLPYVRRKAQFVAISSLSALKGSGEEGLGYSASKAALSISFESLSIKFRNKYGFKVIYFGPIKTGMNPFAKHSLLTLSEKSAVNSVIKTINNANPQQFYPWYLVTILLISKNISVLYFQLLRFIDFLHRKNKEK